MKISHRTGRRVASSRRRARPRPDPVVRSQQARRAGTALALLAVTVTLGLTQSASADPRPTSQQISARVEALEREAAEASEEYNAIRERMKGLAVRGQAATARAEAQERRVAAVRRELGRLAAEQYKSGDLATLTLLLGDDPDAALAASGTLLSLSDRTGAAVEDLTAAQRQLDADRADLAAQARRLTATRSVLRAARDRVEGKLAAARRELGRLQEGQRAALMRASRSNDREGLARALGKDLPASGRVTCGDVGVKPASARVAKVLDYACAQLGDPYLWGGDGPDSFDCSGLTQQAWARAGVSLPHNAAMQSRLGRRVSANELQPGDLVFYHSPISHMGMYLGSGLMIHAPRTGDVVKISPVRYHQMVAAVRL